MIDWTRVQALHDEIGTEDFDEVVNLFLDEVAEAAARLASSDRNALAADLHFLKGSAMSLGFAEFATLCADGERMAAGGQSDGVDLSAILDCLGQSRARFLADLPKMARSH